ncbi:MAG: cellulase family glycosylhydrolase [Patescibacteria group bacterium]
MTRTTPSVPVVIDPQKFGVSFSLKQCRNFGIDPRETMRWLIDEAGFRRFRLMSYWNEHEKKPGTYNFSELDWQMEEAAKNGCLVTLCLGARQPRWPENHWPDWAWKLSKNRRTEALLQFIQQVVERYRMYDNIVSYQLENEALLKNFGVRPEIDRKRLRQEYRLIQKLDPDRPVIMTTSTSWGIPIRRPIPSIIGFSYYRILYGGGKYRHAFHFPRLDRVRARSIKLLHRRPSFVHELQLEPWGPTAIWKMPAEEQDKSMSPAHIRENVSLARKTRLYPIDLWGGEWWYWRLKSINDPGVWLTVQAALTNP